ncbi:hypothetical protein [Actinoplanes sp. TFC3]|uniref:hypothetical protein n=1 Tax=Actinoplanes sp. TFC3 TaxID=1710355 RepID=UPI000830C4F3|nr:hypothetical protein [Actinoplanes sp. TFC3]
MLINHFPALARGYRRGRAGAALTAVADLGRATPPFDREALRLMSRHGCSLVQALPGALDELATIDPSFAALVATLRSAVDEVHEYMDAYRPTARDVPAEAFTLASRYADCYAVAACVQVWLRNREAAGDGVTAGSWQNQDWLRACLARLATRLSPRSRPPSMPPTWTGSCRTCAPSTRRACCSPCCPAS